MPKPVVAWTITRLPTLPLKPQASLSVTVHGRIDPGWHIYTLEEPPGGPLETVVALADGDGADLLHVEQSQPDSVMDVAFGQRTTMFRAGADFTLQLRLGRELEPGPTTLHVMIRYQSCNDHVCLPPRTDTIALPIVVRR